MKNIEIIFSTNSGSKELALSELRKLYKNSNFVKWLNDEGIYNNSGPSSSTILFDLDKELNNLK